MYQTLEIRKLITTIGGIAAVIFVALLWYAPPDDSWMAWIKHVSAVASGTATVLFLFGNKWVFPYIWRLKWVQAITFPYVAGDWVGTISSNWPVVKAMMDAYASGGSPKPQGELDIMNLAPELKRIRVTITADLFSIVMRLETLDRYSVSGSLVVKPQAGTALEPAKLMYLYQNQTDVPVQTDSSAHLGAAVLCVAEEGNKLEGTYWTARNWTKGLNTAGRIELRRSDKTV